MTPALTIVDALRDRQLFGGLPAFRDLTTWRPWLTFLRAVYGLPMDACDLDLFRRHTGLEKPRDGGYAEAVSIVGCQSGKSQIAALVGVYEAAKAVMAGESGLYVPLIAQDLRGARRALFRYAKEAVSGSEVLQHEVVRETADTLEIAGVSLVVYPCRPSSVRGIRAACAVIDELAFFTATDGHATDTEMLRSVRTRLATTGGKLLILSSPYAQAGALWNLHRRHYGQESSPTLVWQAAAMTMNPTLPADYLERMEQEDPEAYRSEVLGEFRAGLSSLFDVDALEEVRADWRERAREDGRAYRAFVDPSGGRADAFAVAVGHAEDKLAVVDAVRAWPAPFNPATVTGECAALLQSYGVREVEGDRYAGEWPREAFRSHGVTYTTAEKTTSENYLHLLPTVNQQAVLLPRDEGLFRELRGLERRRGQSGRDRVDHRRGAHDDRATAVAGLVYRLRTDSQRRGTGMFNCFTGEPIEAEDSRWSQFATACLVGA